MYKILLTGGHAATTGIAVVEEIRKTKDLKDAEIYWVGSQIAMEGTKISTMESRVFPKIGIKFIPIVAGKLQTKFTLHTIPSILKIPIGFFQAFWLLSKIKPNVVFSFGGYSSFPVVFWSWFFRIPVILHEQTVAAGRASILSASFASKIALAREESRKYFPAKKVVLTGNPLMQNVLGIKKNNIFKSPQTIFVIGGSRGSNFINELVMEIGAELLSSFKIIHVTGENDYEMILKYKEMLPANLAKNYDIYSSIDPLKIGDFYSKANIIISRSGANSVSEIIYAKRPAILIPLPRTFMNEQVKNAEYVRNFGFATVLLENEAKPEVVIKEILRISKEGKENSTSETRKINPDIHASKMIVDIIRGYL